jgi:hypothetical protein
MDVASLAVFYRDFTNRMKQQASQLRKAETAAPSRAERLFCASAGLDRAGAA